MNETPTCGGCAYFLTGVLTAGSWCAHHDRTPAFACVKRDTPACPNRIHVDRPYPPKPEQKP